MKKYTAIYFDKTTKIIKKFKPDSIVTLQFFQRSDNVLLAGIDESLRFLEKHTNTKNYKIKYMREASIINAHEVVLELEGNYAEFGLYEGLIDGILARSTSIATNAYRLTSITKKPIIFMGDRADYYANQALDGYAASLGGIKTQVTKEQTKYHDGNAVGTIPHALIQMFGGDIIKTLEAYSKTFPKEKLVALVDFNNDVIKDSLIALKKFSEKLSAVRVDTSNALSDKMFTSKKEYGVTPNMIKKLRVALDKNNGKHVKIIASSGINDQKIMKFEKAKAPVDIYGVGSWILKINIGFTADAVRFNGKKIAKTGRHYRVNKKLINYN